MKRRLLLTAGLALALLWSCEAVFTNSFVEFAQRDLINLSPEAQAEAASDVLAGGSEEEQAEAFAALEEQYGDDWSSAPVDLAETAADLAISSSGLNADTIIGIADDLLGEGGPSEDFSINDLFDGFTQDDFANMLAGAEIMDTVIDNPDAEVSTDQLILAGVAAIAAAANTETGGTGEIDLETFDPDAVSPEAESQAQLGIDLLTAAQAQDPDNPLLDLFADFL